MSTNGPATHDHNGFAPKSDISAGISEVRATAVMEMMTKNGPSTRANMRVLIHDSCEELITTSVAPVVWSKRWPCVSDHLAGALQ
jgi:hypothetical protein